MSKLDPGSRRDSRSAFLAHLSTHVRWVCLTHHVHTVAQTCWNPPIARCQYCMSPSFYERLTGFRHCKDLKSNSNRQKLHRPCSEVKIEIQSCGDPEWGWTPLPHRQTSNEKFGYEENMREWGHKKLPSWERCTKSSAEVTNSEASHRNSPYFGALPHNGIFRSSPWYLLVNPYHSVHFCSVQSLTSGTLLWWTLRKCEVGVFEGPLRYLSPLYLTDFKARWQ